MKMEKMYVAPEVEVLLMEVELGFAGSGDNTVTPPDLSDEVA